MISHDDFKALLRRPIVAVTLGTLPQKPTGLTITDIVAIARESYGLEFANSAVVDVIANLRAMRVSIAYAGIGKGWYWIPTKVQAEAVNIELSALEKSRCAPVEFAPAPEIPEAKVEVQIEAQTDLQVKDPIPAPSVKRRKSRK